MNKKVLLTIFLATLLALCTAIFAFYKLQNSHPPKTLKQKEEIKVEVEKEFPEVKQEEVKTKVQQQPKKAQKVYPKQTVKPKAIKEPAKKQKAEPIKKEQIENKNINNEEKISVKNSEEESGAVVIPVKYTTKNTYKYVYTPNRF